MPEQVINSQKSLDAYIEHVRAQFDKHKFLRVSMKTGKQRTLTQNAAMHLYCTQLAAALSDAGYDFRTSLRHDVEVPWNATLALDYLWRPVQVAITGHESTTKPETKQYGEIYEALNRHISTRFGVYVPWPCKDTQREALNG